MTVNPFGFAILIGLNRSQKPIYQGTVSAEKKARRRSKGKAAKAARKLNRARS